MSSQLDGMTDGGRERELMRRVRGGGISVDDVADQLPAFFMKLQVQTASPCNAACTMCPWPATMSTQSQGVMSEKVFEAIVDQIAGRGVERVSLFLMNEPLLDPKLEQRTRMIKGREPAARTVIYTNGLLLDGARARALADAGMDEISVSVNGFTRDVYERYMQGLDFDVVMSNLHEVGRALRDSQLGSMTVHVVGLDMPGTRAGAEAFQDATGLPFFLKSVTNRAGAIDADPLRTDPLRISELPTACQRPFVKAYVLYNGDMVLCNCDWERTTIVGNVLDRPLAELWHDHVMTEVRQMHIRRTFAAGSLCASCDYPFLISADQ